MFDDINSNSFPLVFSSLHWLDTEYTVNVVSGFNKNASGV